MTKDDWQPIASATILTQRAKIIWQLRDFFYRQGFSEVQTPTISRDTVVDRYIDPVVVAGSALACSTAKATEYYLQTSPEFCMKRLLAAGMNAIYQLGPAYRASERGQFHNPEFTMLEWYRVGDSFDKAVLFLSRLTDELFARFRPGMKPTVAITYQQAFQSTLSIDPLTCSIETLQRAARESAVSLDSSQRSAKESAVSLTSSQRAASESAVSLGSTPPARESAVSLGSTLGSSWESRDRDDWLNLLFAECVQPRLGTEGPVIVTHYPATQAALASVSAEDPRTAERFELFAEGIELANGYGELLDANELLVRSERVLSQRRSDGKSDLPVDNRLIAAMNAGLPASCGCALGVDRLVMVCLDANTIDDVIAFPIERA